MQRLLPEVSRDRVTSPCVSIVSGGVLHREVSFLSTLSPITKSLDSLSDERGRGSLRLTS